MQLTRLTHQLTPTVLLHARLIYLMTDYIYCDFDYLFLVQTSVVMPTVNEDIFVDTSK